MVNNNEIAVIGVIPIEIIQDQTHTLGSVSVSHTVGSGVRTLEGLGRKKPEQLQFRAILLGDDRFTKKLALEEISNLRLPVPFISGITALPLVVIEQLIFMQNSGKKDLNGNPIIDFIITIREFQVSQFIKLGVKLAWLAWTLATRADVGTGRKLPTTLPDTQNLTAVLSSEYLQYEIDEDITSEELGDPGNWSEQQIAAAKILNARWDKIPINVDGAFPQAIKLQYPPSTESIDEFNDVANLPANYVGYSMPSIQTAEIEYIILKFAPRDTDSGIQLILEAEIDNEIVFFRKVVTGVEYKINGKFSVIFSEIDIKIQNLQPENRNGGSFGTKLNAGIRLI